MAKLMNIAGGAMPECGPAGKQFKSERGNG